MNKILNIPWHAFTFTYQLSQRALNCIISPFVKVIEDKIAAPILKACVFREAAFQSRFSKNVFLPTALMIVNIWFRCANISRKQATFDKKRLQRSKDFLKVFGQEKIAKTKDGVNIAYAHYRAKDFRDWIQRNGGVIQIKDDHVLIKAKDDACWKNLQNLRNFKIFEEIDKSFKLPKAIRGAENKCIFRCQGSGREMTMDKKYIGLHLALGFDYVVFNYRNEASLKNYFKDAEAVLETLRKNYNLDQVIAQGSCRATFIVSHLKEKYHDQGLNAVLIHPVPDLKSTINVKKGIIKKVALLGLKALQKNDASFNNLERLDHLKKNRAKTFVIVSEGDKTLPSNTGKLFKDAIKDKSPLLIWQLPSQKGSDAHFSDPLFDRKNYIHYANVLVGNNSIPSHELI